MTTGIVTIPPNSKPPLGDRSALNNVRAGTSKALLCLPNWSSDAIASLTIHVDASALKPPPAARAADAMTGEALPLDNAALTLSLPAKWVRLVEVR